MILLDSDIEYLLITISLMLLFIAGIKRRQNDYCNISDFVRGGG